MDKEKESKKIQLNNNEIETVNGGLGAVKPEEIYEDMWLTDVSSEEWQKK